MSDRLFSLEQEISHLKQKAQQGWSAAQAYEDTPHTNRLLSLEQSLIPSDQFGGQASQIVTPAKFTRAIVPTPDSSGLGVAEQMARIYIAPLSQPIHPLLITTLRRVTPQNPVAQISTSVLQILNQIPNVPKYQGNVTLQYFADKQWKISGGGSQPIYLCLNGNQLEVHDSTDSLPGSSSTSAPQTSSPSTSTLTANSPQGVTTGSPPSSSGMVTGLAPGKPGTTNQPSLAPTTTPQSGTITSGRTIPSVFRKSDANYARHKSTDELRARFEIWKKMGWTCWTYFIDPSQNFHLPLEKKATVSKKDFNPKNFQESFSKTSKGFTGKRFTGCFAHDWGLTIYSYQNGPHYKGSPDGQLAQEIFTSLPWLRPLLAKIWPELSRIVSQRGFHGITFQGFYYGDKVERVIAIGLSPDRSQFEIIVDSSKKHGYLWQFKRNEDLQETQYSDDNEASLDDDGSTNSAYLQ